MARSRLDDPPPRVRYRPNDCGVQLPPATDFEHACFHSRLRDEQHAFLRFAEKDLVRRHGSGTAGYAVQVNLDAVVGPSGHLNARRGQPSGSHVLNAFEQATGEQFKTRFEQELAHKGVAHLHGGSHWRTRRNGGRRSGGRELVAGHGRPMDAVPTGLRADVQDAVADACGPTVENAVGRGNSAGERVDQDVAVVALVELQLAANGRNADAVSIAANAGDHAAQELGRARVIRTAKAQRIEASDGAGAHREHIAQDSADSCGRALVRLDKARVVVRLHLEDRGETIADVDDARVLPRPLNDARPFGRQTPQVNAARLVGAVLAPHHAKDPELGISGFAPQRLKDLPVLLVGQLVLPYERGSNGRVIRETRRGHERTCPLGRNTLRANAEPGQPSETL